MKHEHHYTIRLDWTGNSGSGSSGYKEYERSHSISAEGKAVINGSSDPAFRGDATLYNPEELFLSSLSSCHMLWYLHLCSVNSVVVTEYSDNPTGLMLESADGSGKFTEVVLNPCVRVKEKEMEEKALELHFEAHKMCFIANSVNFPVLIKPSISTQ